MRTLRMEIQPDPLREFGPLLKVRVSAATPASGTAPTEYVDAVAVIDSAAQTTNVSERIIEKLRGP